ncbi:MAG TPA: glutaredoxin domain-containing protein [Polyangiaceae bacterium]|nr:glutaredoxin domain-containing protein [Polyangiaceae bacterium]
MPEHGSRPPATHCLLRLRVRYLACVVAALAALAASACKSKPSGDDGEPVSAAPQSHSLPPLELRDDTTHLLLTWVDEKGDFHVVQKPNEVPKEGRAKVRVVVTSREEGTGKVVYVADLTKPNAKGVYPVRTMARSEWDEVGASRRKARLEALAPSALPPSGSAAPGHADPGGPGQASSERVVAVIYGASWCKPCHDAASYLRQRGVTVIEKDIEQNQVAASEMRGKLQKAGMPPSSSIPIIDVMGRLMVGFSPSALDRAIQAAESATSL